MRRSTPLLLALPILLLAAAAAWILRAGGPGEALDHGAGASVERSATASRAEPLIATPTSPDARAPDQRREATAAVPPAEGPLLRGRVVYPPGTPEDEEVLVEVRGRRFADGPRTRSVRPGADGHFEARFAPGTTVGWLRVEGRTLDMRTALEVRPGPDAAPVELEPILGACLRVRVALPPDVARRDSPVRVVAIPSRHGSSESRTVECVRERHAELRAEVRGVAIDTLYDLEVRSDETVTRRIEGLDLSPGEVRELDLELRPGARLAGRVSDPSGRPLEDVEVVATSDDGHDHPDAVRIVRALSDGNGSFELNGLLPGEIDLEASLQRHAPTTQRLGAVAEGEARRGIELVLGLGRSLAGRVQWPDGSPAVDAEVAVLRIDARRAAPVRSRSDGDGAFSVGGLKPGPYRVSARARPALPAPLDADRDPGGEAAWRCASLEGVGEGTADLRLVLEPGDRLAGIVVDDRGEPVRRFRIDALPAPGERSGAATHDGFRERFDEASGRFVLDGLAPGSWQVRAESSRHAAGRTVRVEMPAGSPAGELALVLPRTASVAGIVRSPTGDPVANARVTSSGPRGATGAVRSDDDGGFRIRRLAPGRTTLTASSAGWAPGTALVVVLEPGHALEDLEVGVAAGATLIGELHEAVELPEKRRVSLQPAGSWDSLRAGCDAEGRFLFEGLPAGTYTASLDWTDRGAGGDWIDTYAERGALRIELAAGEQRHVVLCALRDRTVRVTGRILDDGEPVVEALVYAFLPGESMPVAIGRSDDSGAYELLLSSTGTHVLTAGPGQGSQTRFEIDVPDVEELTLDLDMPTGSIAGELLGPDGTPLPGRTMMLLDEESDPEERALGSLRTVTTDARGRFVFENLDDGRWSLRSGGWTRDPGTAEDSIEIVSGLEVVGGQALPDVTLRLRDGATLEGTVIDAAGRPASAVAISVLDAQGRPLRIWSRPETDYGGAFRFPRLPPGRLTLVATGPDGGTARVELEVLEGETRTVELVLEP